MVKGYRDLEVWRRSHLFVLRIYQATGLFPKEERFGLVSQLRRAAYSVPANIAEGFGRRHTRELLQALAIANGSLEELRYFLLLGKDLHYTSTETYAELEREAHALGQMLTALARSLKKRAEVGVGVSARNTGHG